MKIKDINEKIGDLAMELSKQFQAEFIRLAETENCYMSLDEILMEEWQEPTGMEGPQFGEGTPTITPEELRFPTDATIDPYSQLDEGLI